MRATASWLLRIGLLPVVCSLGGCTPFMTGKLAQGKSPLRPAQMSPDACVLEIIFARFAPGDPQANDVLWREIDEQHFSTETRRELARQGFRVGLVAGQMPVTLSRLLDLKEDAPPAGGANHVNVEDLATPPRVVGRHLQLRAGCRSEVVASPIYNELTAMECEPWGVCGRTYAKAQGILAVRALPERDGRVRLDVVPEVHYGEPGKRWLGDQGAWRLDTSRQKRVLENLALSATLTPGELLVMAALPDRPGSLGHYFFTDDTSGEPEQKLLLIRLAQTQHDGLFSGDETLPVDQIEP